MSTSTPQSPTRYFSKKARGGSETGRQVLRVLVLLGFITAVIGVAIFTYSVAYPSVEKTVHLGSLTLAQLSFWLIVGGVGTVGICSLISHTLMCIAKRSMMPIPVTINAGIGTGYDDEEAEVSSPLLGSARGSSNRANRGSASGGPAAGSPFSSSSKR